MRGKDLLRRASIPLEERYYGNARNFRADELAQLLRGHDPDLSHVTVTEDALPADPRGRLRRRDRDAVRRPVHLAARRHPGQGRQDDHGQLAGAAGAVPRPRGVRARQHAAARPAGATQRRRDEVRAAAGDGADRAGARPEPAQARLPGADGGLPGRPAARLGAARSSTDSQTDEWLDREQVLGDCWHARRAEPSAAGKRIAPPSLGAAGLHGLARHLRRGADQARRSRRRSTRSGCRPCHVRIVATGASSCRGIRGRSPRATQRLNAPRAGAAVAGRQRQWKSRRRRRSRPRSGCRS